MIPCTLDNPWPAACQPLDDAPAPPITPQRRRQLLPYVAIVYAARLSVLAAAIGVLAQ